jgi:hypothetical protein
MERRLINMDKIIDKILIRSGFMKRIIAKTIEKYIHKQFGKNAEIFFGDTDVVYEDNVLMIDITKLHIEIESKDLLTMIDDL